MAVAVYKYLVHCWLARTPETGRRGTPRRPFPPPFRQDCAEDPLDRHVESGGKESAEEELSMVLARPTLVRALRSQGVR